MANLKKVIDQIKNEKEEQLNKLLNNQTQIVPNSSQLQEIKLTLDKIYLDLNKIIIQEDLKEIESEKMLVPEENREEYIRLKIESIIKDRKKLIKKVSKLNENIENYLEISRQKTETIESIVNTITIANKELEITEDEHQKTIQPKETLLNIQAKTLSLICTISNKIKTLPKITENVYNNVKGIITKITNIGSMIYSFGKSTLSTISNWIGSVFNFFEKYGGYVISFFTTTIKYAWNIVKWVTYVASLPIQAIYKTMKFLAGIGWDIITKTFSVVLDLTTKASSFIFDVLYELITNPLFMIGTVAFFMSSTFRNYAIDGIKNIFKSVFEFLFGENFIEKILGVVPVITTFIGSKWNDIQSFFNSFVELLVAKYQALQESTIWSTIVQPLLGITYDAWLGTWEFIKSSFNDYIKPLFQFIINDFLINGYDVKLQNLIQTSTIFYAYISSGKYFQDITKRFGDIWNGRVKSNVASTIESLYVASEEQTKYFNENVFPVLRRQISSEITKRLSVEATFIRNAGPLTNDVMRNRLMNKKNEIKTQILSLYLDFNFDSRITDQINQYFDSIFSNAVQSISQVNLESFNELDAIRNQSILTSNETYNQLHSLLERKRIIDIQFNNLQNIIEKDSIDLSLGEMMRFYNRGGSTILNIGTLRRHLNQDLFDEILRDTRYIQNDPKQYFADLQIVNDAIKNIVSVPEFKYKSSDEIQQIFFKQLEIFGMTQDYFTYNLGERGEDILNNFIENFQHGVMPGYTPFAEGGVVNVPTFAIVGEGQSSELIIPFNSDGLKFIKNSFKEIANAEELIKDKKDNHQAVSVVKKYINNNTQSPDKVLYDLKNLSQTVIGI